MHLAAAKGHTHCVNCLIQHGANTSILNSRGDDVIAVAKRHGHPVAVKKAIDGTVMCLHCEKQRKHRTQELAKRPTAVEANIHQLQASIFESGQVAKGVGKQSRGDVTQSAKSPKRQERSMLPRREMAAKYFGQQYN